ncbi:hypothetical protein [Amycolatopsis sp. cmx-4-68]|uniref:hypothetical protein n=1 Tax=Amycolatopsis sp. cmx-4-68 TaxID=2790938 RepID=UPI00397BE56C
MNDHEEAKRFLDKYKEAHGIPAYLRAPTTAAREAKDRILHRIFTREQSRNPKLRTEMKHAAGLAVRDGVDAVMVEILDKRQGDIENAAAALAASLSIDGWNAGDRPLVGFLLTGQLNAVTMPVPGSADHLVLFEDQMMLFIVELSSTIACSVRRDHPTCTGDGPFFKVTADAMREQIAAHPEIAVGFANSVIGYAVTGRIKLSAPDRLTPDNARFADELSAALMYFVLGHERAHILLGHLHTAEVRTGVLPDAEAEALVYSWVEETEADLLGMQLSMIAGTNYGKLDFALAFLGISLFFDALDVMDRAVALLQTGDENALQLGSHPPAHLRKQYLGESLVRSAPDDNRFTLNVRRALRMAEAQSEIIRRLWECTRPDLLDLHQRGARAAPTWRTNRKEAGDQSLPT